MPDSRFHLVDTKGEHIRPVLAYSLDANGNPVLPSGGGTVGLVSDVPWAGAGDGTLDALLKTIALAALSTNPVQTYRADLWVRLTASGLVKAGAGSLSRLTVNAPGAGVTATIYNNAAGSGAVIAGPITLAANMSLPYDLGFDIGCYIALSGACDITVMYR